MGMGKIFPISPWTRIACTRGVQLQGASDPWARTCRASVVIVSFLRRRHQVPLQPAAPSVPHARAILEYNTVRPAASSKTHVHGHARTTTSDVGGNMQCAPAAQSEPASRASRPRTLGVLHALRAHLSSEEAEPTMGRVDAEALRAVDARLSFRGHSLLPSLLEHLLKGEGVHQNHSLADGSIHL